MSMSNCRIQDLGKRRILCTNKTKNSPNGYILLSIITLFIISASKYNEQWDEKKNRAEHLVITGAVIITEEFINKRPLAALLRL